MPAVPSILAVVTALSATLIAPLAAPEIAGAAPAATLSEQAARARAVTTGKPVEATALRDEHQQVVANPDGTFTLTQSIQAVRVRRGTGWVPVDTTLRRTSDGGVAPAAAVLDMSFSGGGTAPLARMRRHGAELSLTWPGTLPAPTLAGDTATYAEVLPGVDLMVRASAEGFSEVLVVKSAAAAANSALGSLRLATAVKGVRMTMRGDGSLAAADSAGNAVFEAPAPYMWDSTGQGSSSVPGGTVRRMGVRVTPGALALEPDRQLLTSPATRYPVYIDPSWSGSRLAWTQVWSNLSTTSFWNGANDAEDEARVGYDATDGKKTRSFFRFDTSGVKGKHILQATLQTQEVWSRSCTAREVQVWETGGISSSTTWSKQPSWITKLTAKSFAKGYSSSCPAGGVEFTVTPHVVKAAAAGSTTITEGLRASSTAETNYDTLSWKRFKNNPSITIVYNTVPGAPTNLSTDGSTTCTTGTGRLVIGTPTPTLRASVSDADNAVMAHFQWWLSTGTAPVGEYTSSSVAGSKPTVVAKTIPSGAFTNGQIGKWRVRSEDGTDVSGWSSWCEFQIDTTRPPIPTVTSSAFPDNVEGDAVMGVASSVTVGANGGADVAKYEYALNGAATALNKTATPAAAGGAVTFAVTPDRFVNWLQVRAVDAAGNRSEVATMVFYAGSPPGPVGDWQLNETGEDAAAVDSSTNARDAALGGGATWNDGYDGGGLSLDGTSGYAATAGPVLDTMKSFSVSAWVYLTDLSHNTVALTQIGDHASGLTLYYSSSYKKWIFNRTTVDADTTTFVRAISTTTPVTNTWVHLAGVYDAPAGQIRLYVNGVLEATTAFTSPWAATGVFQIGRSRVASVFGEYWPGRIDAVQAYDRVLLPGELQQVPRLAGRWKMDETSGTVAADATGAHPATWSSTGVSRVAGVSGNAVAVNGTTGVLTTSGPAVRTDGSFSVSAWVQPSALTKNGIAVSQLGTAVGAFNLGWAWSDDYSAYLWSVRTSATDVSGSSLREATDLFDVPTAGVWTHLAAVYDAQEHSLRLYVDGQAVDQTSHASAWNAAGALLIGRGQASNVTFSQYLTGAIDDVRVYSGALSDQAVFDIYNATAE
ncbi:LamG-like jellyroll fold domain-containing protein [Micromonospora sp. NPDC048930]|uniref:LamG-like jellyroll fold domain-containing protein n=1 Tax=Micromonospora sp. NPDC048930 TaxID=3364261 RepID=UPI003715EF87